MFLTSVYFLFKKLLLVLLLVEVRVMHVSWRDSERSDRLTILSFIAPKVSPVAEHDLQVVALVKCRQDSQQQQDDPEPPGQLQSIHVYSQREGQRGREEEELMRITTLMAKIKTKQSPISPDKSR